MGSECRVRHLDAIPVQIDFTAVATPFGTGVMGGDFSFVRKGRVCVVVVGIDSDRAN